MSGENANTPIGYDSSGKPVYYNGVGERPAVATKYAPGNAASELGQGNKIGAQRIPSTAAAAERAAVERAAQPGQPGQPGQGGMPGGGGNKGGSKENRRKTKYVLEEELDVGTIQRTDPRVVGLPDEDERNGQ
jgi:hypothetical protein